MVDKRRPDLVIPYVHVPPKAPASSMTIGSTLPMAAMFMKSKILAWCAMFSALQGYLNEPTERGTDAQPAIMTLGIATMGVLVCYMDFVGKRPVPKGPVEAAAETATSVVEAAVEAAKETVKAAVHKLT